MAGRVTETGKDGSGVDQLSERRRRNQPHVDAVPETIASVEPVVRVAPRLVDPPAPEPYSLVSSLGLDDEPELGSDVDEILDALSDSALERESSRDLPEDAEDEIGAQLHHHHERAARMPAGPRTPRGSAELSPQAPRARGHRSTRARAKRHTSPAARTAALRAHPVRSGIASAAGVAVAAVVVAVLLTGGSSPRVKAKLPAVAPSAQTSATAAALKLVASTGTMSTRLLVASTDTATKGKRLHRLELAQQRAARQRKAHRAHERAKRAAQRKARREKAAGASEQAHSTTEPSTAVTSGSSTATTPADSYDDNSGSTSSDPTPTVSSSSNASSSSSSGGSASPAPAGPSGAGSASGCDPKCT